MIYAVFFAYSADDIGCKPTTEQYPRKYRRTAIYKTEGAVFNAYANTHCPASQYIEATDEQDLKDKINQLDRNFDDIKWLEKNIFPYL